jgi:lipopolysaccharide/colanic/teichoic acid biosynthesis glycosyltransferase
MAGAHAALVGELFLLQPQALLRRARHQRIKRLVDVAASLFMLLFTAPLLILVTVLVWLTAAGPVFLVETCLGANGKGFSRYRLRTTVARPGQSAVAAKGSRMTRLGRLLRATHIDELPQLVNVLLGDMSLVGPAPEPPELVRLYRARFPAYELRFAVKPGILGLAQMDCGDSTEPELKLHYDLKYIYQESFLTDFRILLRTFLPILPENAAKASGEQPARSPVSTPSGTNVPLGSMPIAAGPIGHGMDGFRPRLID